MNFKMSKASQVVNYLRSWDIFGHQLSVHHKGDSSHKTLLGFFVSVCVFGLIVSNFITLYSGFLDNSKHEETSNFQVYDRHYSDVYNLTESGVHMALFAFQEHKDRDADTVAYYPLTPDIGRYTIKQHYPCPEDDAACRTGTSPHLDREFVFSDCDSARKDEFSSYWEARLGPLLSGFTANALCLTQEEEDTLQIAEDPYSLIESRTLQIKFEYCEEFVTSESNFTCKTEEEVNEWMASSDLGLQLDLHSLDMNNETYPIH